MQPRTQHSKLTLFDQFFKTMIFSLSLVSPHHSQLQEFMITHMQDIISFVDEKERTNWRFREEFKTQNLPFQVVKGSEENRKFMHVGFCIRIG
jgi:hypothetical protein